jgi:uncharacterized repeat protein (TIGR03803 family)
MTSHKQFSELMCGKTRLAANRVMLGFIMVFALVLLGLTTPARAQNFQVIYNFTGGEDGGNPFTGLTIDAAGNIYGTAFTGGMNGYGTVFSLDNDGSGWVLSPLHSFAGGGDGEGPASRLIVGPNGLLYGTTSAGGGGPCSDSNGNQGCGTVYTLQPPPRAPASVLVSWSSNVLYQFQGSDGAYPQGDLSFDSAGNIYGTTVNGGSADWGVVYSLTHSDGGWAQSVLYQATDNGNGQYPWGGVAIDSSGNLYGTFSENGSGGYGSVYKLTRSGSGWSESTIHSFTYQGNNGAAPQGGLIFDQAGNLYGTTVHDSTGGGTVFELTSSGNNWNYDYLYGFNNGIDIGPYDKLLMDAAGNLYGTTFADGRYGYGSVFKLTRSGGGWNYTSLHDFTGGSDGLNPVCRLEFDSSGNLYGTASGGGAYQNGVVFEITAAR